MQQGVSRKIAVIVLSIMTLALLGVGVVILLQLQNNQSPEETQAFGFGSSAITIYFDEVGNTFKSIPCEEYFRVTSIYPVPLLPLHDYILTPDYEVKELPLPENDTIVKRCEYKLSPTQSIFFTVESYISGKSVIAESRQQLYAVANADLIRKETIDSQRIGKVRYFFGEGVQNNSCTMTMFHYQNDFRYAAVTYTGIANCEEHVKINREIAEIFGSKIDSVMFNYEVDDETLTNLDPENYDFSNF